VHENDRARPAVRRVAREHELLPLLPAEARTAVARCRGEPARHRRQLRADGAVRCGVVAGAGARARLPIDEAIEFLWALRPQDLGRWLRPADIASLDRVVRVLSVAPVRWLPLIRRVAVCPLPATPEERIVRLGRRIADWLESWHGRMLFFADLHGIVTGPQILDRVATALVKATQRPAVRLVLFGGLFSLPRLSACDSAPRSERRCWCSAASASASAARPLAEAAGRSGGGGLPADQRGALPVAPRAPQAALRGRRPRLPRRRACSATASRQRTACVCCARSSTACAPACRSPTIGGPRRDPPRSEPDALLYLHYLDGAPLHGSDVQTTEQLLANTSLANLRLHFLGFDAREKKRLRKLKLDDGSLFSGPYLWFRFITESIAVEAAKRIDGYNRYCIPTAERGVGRAGGDRGDARLAANGDAIHAAAARRRTATAGRSTATRRPSSRRSTSSAAIPSATGTSAPCSATRCSRSCASTAARWCARSSARARCTTCRSRTAASTRCASTNGGCRAAACCWRRCCWRWRFLRSFGWLVGRVRRIVREVLDPELAMQRREIGQAPFAVAQRKIHRMKAPGLLEAIRLRLELDPVYAGAPAGWSRGGAVRRRARVRTRPAVPAPARARRHRRCATRPALVRQQIEALHAALAGLPDLATGPTSVDRARGRRTGRRLCVDRRPGRRAHAAVRGALAQRGARRTGGAAGAAVVGSEALAVAAWGFVLHPVDRWLARTARRSDRAGGCGVAGGLAPRLGGTRELLTAWAASCRPGPRRRRRRSPPCARRSARGLAMRRDLMALRAVQSLAVLDIRNYRDLVFRLGDYGGEGESADAALP
jgi:hypothetical protein